MMKFYTSTAWDAKDKARQLNEVLTEAGWENCYDWTVEKEGEKLFEDIARDEIAAIIRADVVFVLLPGFQGTHTELGAALSAGRQVIINSPNKEHAPPEGIPCPFYYHPNVTINKKPFEEFLKIAGSIAWELGALKKTN